MRNQTIILRMTDNCNLNCTYCYDKMNKNKDKNNFEKDIEEVIKYILFLNNDEKQVQKIILHGGEPLTIPINQYEIFLEKLTKKLPKCKFSIQTNATLLTVEHIKLFEKYNINVGISLDGCNEEQNSCRIYKDGHNSFDKVMQSIELLQKSKIHFGIIVTISKKHINQEKELYNFIKENNLRCSIRPAFPVKNSKNDMILSSNEYYNFFKNLFDIWYDDESGAISINQIADLYDELFKVLESKYRVNCCSDCETCFGKFISLDRKGNVYSCNRTYGLKEFYYGNINEITKEELNSKIESFNKNRVSYLRNSKCTSCKIYEYCYGGCPASAFNIYGTYLSAEDIFCDAKIKIHEYIIKKLEKNGDLEYYKIKKESTKS